MAKDKVNFVQLEAKAFVADLADLSTLESGAYVRLVFFLLNNHGRIPFDLKKIELVCGQPDNFEEIWRAIEPKFTIKQGHIFQKRALAEVKKAKRLMQAKRRGGLTRAKQIKDTASTPDSTLDKTPRAKGKGKVNKRIYSQNSDEFRLASLLLGLILKRKPDLKKPDLQKWSEYIDLMVRIDKRKPEKTEAVIRWCQQDGFWQNNILSTKKLRKQFDTLELQMNHQKPGSEPPKICVIDRKPGRKYQTNRQGKKVWLCEECLEALRKVRVRSWGDMAPARLESMVLGAKAKRD